MTFRGALVHKFDVDQSVPSNVNTQLTLSTVIYDTDGFFNPTTNRFVVPTGVSKVRLIAQAIWGRNPTGLRQTVIKKNFITGDLSTGWYPGVPASTVLANGGTSTDVPTSSPIIPVVEGDNFLAEVYQESGGTLNVLKSVGTWFAIEVLG